MTYLRFLSLKRYISERICQNGLALSKSEEMVVIHHVQEFWHPKTFRRGVISENKLKTPKFFKLIRYFVITITTIYIRRLCILINWIDAKSNCLYHWLLKKLSECFRQTFGKKLSKTSESGPFRHSPTSLLYFATL